jgi:sialidase-1
MKQFSEFTMRGAAALFLVYAQCVHGQVDWASGIDLPKSETPVRLFNGRDLSGWEGQLEKYWSVTNGVIRGANEGELATGTYLFTKKPYRNFRLLLEVKQTGNAKYPPTMHSAVAALGEKFEDNGDAFGFKGPLLMFCHDWGIWDMHRRNRIYPPGQPQDVMWQHPSEKIGDWNRIEILVIGNHIRLVNNGQRIIDFTDKSEMLQSSPLGLQLHGNKHPQEYFFRGLILTENPEDRLLTLTANPTPGNAIATIIETKVICREPGKYLGPGSEFGVDKDGHPTVEKRVVESDRYVGWPTLAKTREGELIVAFSGDRDAHVCPWGKTQIIRSHDDGKTWSEPQTITSTPLDDRDAGLIQTKEGTLLVSWFTSLGFEKSTFPAAVERYARHGEKIPEETREKWLGNWVRRSEDGGKTWLEPVRTISTAPHGPIQLRDGRLLYIGNGEWQGKGTIIVEQSSDDGRTWSVLTTISKPQDLAGGFGEPHLVALASGKLLAMFRFEPKDRQCFLMQSESDDGGKTWSPIHSSGIWGYPPHMIQLKNGWVLVSYGYRREPFGERTCISRDDGKTWDVENQILLANAPGPDLGYPSSVQLDDSSILTVYYQAEKFGEPTLLMSTHWRLKD